MYYSLISKFISGIIHFKSPATQGRSTSSLIAVCKDSTNLLKIKLFKRKCNFHITLVLQFTRFALFTMLHICSEASPR